MTKFYGKIGFVETVETAPGVYVEKVTEKPYKGDVVKNYRRWETSSDSINSNFTVNNSIVILADKFAIDHSPRIRYVEWMESYWNVTSISVDRPRLTLELGGVYERATDTDDEETTTPGDSGENPWF